MDFGRKTSAAYNLLETLVKNLKIGEQNISSLQNLQKKFRQDLFSKHRDMSILYRTCRYESPCICRNVRCDHTPRVNHTSRYEGQRQV